MLMREVLVNGSATFRSVCALQISTGLQHLATMRYLELFQITALLYESGFLLRVIRISVKVRIDVTLYDELHFSSIIEKIP